MPGKRAWIGSVYPESAPEDWKIGITQSGIKWACSMIHDQDVFAPPSHKAGEPKKPHYHVCLVWPNPTTWKNASNFLQTLAGSSAVKFCVSVTGTVDYWDHDEETNKVKYDKELIEFYNGFVPEDFADLKKEETRRIKAIIKACIRTYDLCNLWQADEFLEKKFLQTDPDIYDYFTTHTIYYGALIRSFYENGVKHSELDRENDPETYKDSHFAGP